LGLSLLFAQTPVQLGTQPAQIQMPEAEATAYNNAISQSDPKVKAAAIEDYLTKYPNSAVKLDVLAVLMTAYSMIPDAAKTLDAADRILQLDPSNLRALYAEALIRKGNADALTDPAAKQAALDVAAGYAQKGLAVFAAPRPVNVPDADFQALKASASPSYYSVIGFAAFNKNDYATAIDAFKKELASVTLAASKTPGPVLQDTFYLAEAYSQSTPPDLLDCAFYASRVVAYAPAALKPQFSNYANYCYKKYHDGMDGYDALLAAATANLNPPDGLFASIKPGLTIAEKIHNSITGTDDLATLATSDKEMVFQSGSPDDAAKVWNAIKGKSVQIPGALVIASSPMVVKVAVTEDAVQSKTADFTFNMAPPDTIDEPEAPSARATPAQKAAYKTKLAAYIKAVAAAKTKADAIAAATAVGQTVTLTGTYDSYTPNPVQIIMKDGEVILPKPAKPAAPVHHPAPRPAAHN
jgi:tetratricopeptide (TPR) repeat protein